MEVTPDITRTVVSLISAGILVLLNAFFVAAEFAVVKVRRTRLEELAGQGIAQARVSLLCVNELDETLSATQLGITLVSLGLGWIGESAFASLLTILFPGVFSLSHPTAHVVALTISFALITFFHIVLGELVPKSIALVDAERVTLMLSPILFWFYRGSRPLLKFFTGCSDFVLSLLGYRYQEEDPLSENELKLVMKESKEDGVISDSEAQIITRAFEFSDKRASDIMVHRDGVHFLSLSKPVDQNMEIVRKQQRTRFPLCNTDLDDVIGIVHMKDIWPELLVRFSNEAFRTKARPPIFVSPNLRQDQLMRLFQSCRAHMAIVRDDQGRSLGIVTMEDVLERLVGDIKDEHGN